MAANHLPYAPQLMMLLSESLQEWLPERHLAHFISAAIHGLDLGSFHVRYDKEDPRNQPFHKVPGGFELRASATPCEASPVKQRNRRSLCFTGPDRR
jgi:hypothetical protein